MSCCGLMLGLSFTQMGNSSKGVRVMVRVKVMVNNGECTMFTG